MSYWKINYNPNINVQDKDIVNYLASIKMLLSNLRKMPLTPGMQRQLNEVHITRQIFGTTAIEGNTLNEKAIERVMQSGTASNREEQETLNIYETIKNIVEQDKSFYSGEITEDLIKNLHGMITRGIENNENLPGKYRTHEIIVGNGFTGEHFENIPQQMKAFIKFINLEETKSYGELIRAILAHFYLVTIHPFADGNGRTSRMLEACILFGGGYSCAGIFSISNFYYKNRERYFKELDQARFKHKGNLQHFITFALDGYYREVEAAMDQVLEFYKRICFRNLIEELCRTKRINSRQEVLLSLTMDDATKLEESIIYNKSSAINKLLYAKTKSDRTIHRDIEGLKKLGLLNVKHGILSANLDIMQTYMGFKPVFH